jgi:isopentenyl-diphosphate delta-isomerase
MEKVILVNKNDKEIGREDKMKAHREGKLHRAFSVFLFNKRGKLLIQKRAKSKYHSPGLWSNTCCSHPRPDRKLENEVKRRLKEEMGIVGCDLREVFSFTYNLKVGDLIEHEFDHIFYGTFEGNPKPNPREVEDWKWVDLLELKKDIKENPEKYTAWFKLIFNKVVKENES